MYGVIALCGFHFFKAKARQLVDQGITVIPVIIGDEVNKEHVEPVTDDEDRIIPVKPTDKPKDVTDTVDEQITKAIKGKLYDELQGRVVRKPVNVKPGLELYRSTNFSCIKMFLLLTFNVV